MHYADYMMILSPPPEVNHQIQRYKRASANLIGHFESINSKSHITIKSIGRQKTFIAEPAISLMEPRLATMRQFMFQINGFDFYNHADKSLTIYAKLKQDLATTHWLNQLQKNMGLKSRIDPHITVAKAISPEAFNILWPNFARASFSMGFIITCLTILKRDTFADQRNWHVHKVLPFDSRMVS
jgi:2'-5' RNA ligase